MTEVSLQVLRESGHRWHRFGSSHNRRLGLFRRCRRRLLLAAVAQGRRERRPDVLVLRHRRGARRSERALLQRVRGATDERRRRRHGRSLQTLGDERAAGRSNVVREE